jgi:hypothetical protein
MKFKIWWERQPRSRQYAIIAIGAIVAMVLIGSGLEWTATTP